MGESQDRRVGGADPFSALGPPTTQGGGDGGQLEAEARVVGALREEREEESSKTLRSPLNKRLRDRGRGHGLKGEAALMEW